MTPSVHDFLWDAATIALVSPLAGWSLMKLSEELEKAKKSKSRGKVWGVYCAIAFLVMFLLKRF